MKKRVGKTEIGENGKEEEKVATEKEVGRNEKQKEMKESVKKGVVAVGSLVLDNVGDYHERRRRGN